MLLHKDFGHIVCYNYKMLRFKCFFIQFFLAMALEAADDDLDVEIFDELDSYSKIFEELSLQLLEFSYQSDDDLTQHLLTASLDNWSRQTCLSLAVVANNLRFGIFF